MRSSQNPTPDKSEQLSQAYHRIKSLAVTGGFLDGLKVDFDESLNCVIGGRGTGKTTVIELIRFALDKMPDEFFYEAEHNRIQDIVKNNLANGTVRIAVETQDGQTLYIERQSDGDPVVTDVLGIPVESSPSSGVLFNAEIYSQDEIEGIAADPLFQLKLIDKFQTEKISSIESQILTTQKELQKNAALITRARADIEIHQKKIESLPGILQRLKAFQVGGTASANVLRQEIANQALRVKEKAAMDELASFFQSQRDSLDEAASAIPGQFAELFDDTIFQGPNKDALAKWRQQSSAAATQTAQKLSEGSAVLTRGLEQIGIWKSQLTALHVTQDKRYREVLNQHETEKVRAAERENLVKRHNELLTIQKQLEKTQKDSDTLKATRRQLLSQLSQLRDQRYDCRRKVIKWLNEHLNPRIRITLKQFGNVDRYQEALTEAFEHTHSGIQYNRIIPKAVRIAPQDLAAMVDAQEIASLSDKLELTEDQAQKFVDAIRGKDSMYALETVELHDRPAIELQDGAGYKDSASISTGQRCSTILPILLLRSENPLLIDQPENNLDNSFIYDPVVTTIRNLKGKRQFIFVTHNPNIPVVGDAAAVFLMSSNGVRGEVKKHGTVNALKTEIVDLLEGGEDAFKKRWKQYGY